ncbi:CASP8 and FADD-like apoptosis regulator [Oryzias latipes]|uniref:CASP8 and FADD like apoptosis regulator n=1 Tax=Oryzias latipes TaxID=8090 RepID=D6BU25_ORYLA|nr:CASP8 and FADD-like apoptosis regulator [Oryzias latipes]ADB80145.1 FLICE-like inhibitory protein [Oryzias latipes]
MAALDHQRNHLYYINKIVEALSSSECRKLLFLCDSTSADSSVQSVRETLKLQVTCHDNASQFLAEVIWRMGRYDILKELFTLSRNAVEQTLENRQVLSKFRVLMANISEDLDTEDLEQILFLLSTTLPREKRDAKSFLDVIVELEKLDLVSPERVDMVEECLRNICRIDLAKKVSTYKKTAQRCDHHSPHQQSSKTSERRQGKAINIVRESPPTSECRQPSTTSQLEQYSLNSKPRGLCVIIDCVGFDQGMLEQTFKALHFNVVLHPLLGGKQIISCLTEILKQEQNLKGDAFVCCIISRGTANHLLGIDSYGMGVSLDHVRQSFTGNACPMLAGKPKLFFIQTYSLDEGGSCDRIEHRDGDIEIDGCNGPLTSSYIPSEADMFWSHCLTDVSQLDQGGHHSVYLRTLTAALENARIRKADLVDAHTKVNGAVYEHNSRNPTSVYHISVKHTLRKSLYLL